MTYPEDIKKLYEDLNQLKMPTDVERRVGQYIHNLETAGDFRSKWQAGRHRRHLRSISAAAAVVVVFGAAAALVLHHPGTVPGTRTTTTANTSLETGQTSTFDYQPLLHFTPVIPANLPANLHVSYTMASLLSRDIQSYQFMTDYADNSGQLVMRITESMNNTGKAPVSISSYRKSEPGHALKKVSANGETIYVLGTGPSDGTLDGVVDSPGKNPMQVVNMVLVKGNILFKLKAITQYVPEQECIQLLSSLSSSYTRKPTAISEQFYGLSNLPAMKAHMPFSIVLPKDTPAGFKLTEVTALSREGVNPNGQPPDIPVLFQALYRKSGIDGGAGKTGQSSGTATASVNAPGVSIDEKPGSSQYSLPFMDEPVKIGSVTAQYTKTAGQHRLAWYNPTTKVVTVLTANQVTKATLMAFAQSMIN